MVEEKLEHVVEARELRDLINVASKAAEVAWRVKGRSSSSELMVIHAMKELQDAINERRKDSQERLVEKVPAKGSATIHRWPTRLQRKMIQAGDSVARRDAVEKEERTRWIREIRDLLREGGCPATAGALNTAGQDLSRKFGKGRRMSTLRKHAKTWQKVRDWTMVTFRHPWPESPEEFVAYFESRADEPCGHTIPGSIFKTLMFMENAGEYPPAEQLGKSPAIKNALEEINMQLAGNAPNFVKRAWHLPVRVVRAMEEAVLDVRLPKFARAYAWFRLVKLWTGMRCSDTTGCVYELVEWEDEGLTPVLARTKTTGPGKKVTLF